MLLLFAGIVNLEAKHATSRNIYPHELPGFKLYLKYLSPLRPRISDEAEVIRVLASEQGKTVGGWRIWPLYVGDAGSAKGRLAEIQVIPQQPVSMRAVNFPPTFTYSAGTVSEINVNCDVYADNDGLQYWVYAEDSAVGKKGDLMHIVYGASNERKRSHLQYGR